MAFPNKIKELHCFQINYPHVAPTSWAVEAAGILHFGLRVTRRMTVSGLPIADTITPYTLKSADITWRPVMTPVTKSQKKYIYALR
jgi:hypothetical protein